MFIFKLDFRIVLFTPLNQNFIFKSVIQLFSSLTFMSVLSYQFKRLHFFFSVNASTPRTSISGLAVSTFGGDQLSVGSVGLEESMHEVVAHVVPNAVRLAQLHRVGVTGFCKIRFIKF
jgi:hypothetical protein